MSFLLTVVLLVTSASAQTLHMGLLGGSGEPHRTRDGRSIETTIFDPGVENFAAFNRSHPGIRSTVSFNGGHAVTEGIIERGFGSGTPFTAREYQRIIEDYKRKILSGEITRGDRLLLNLYSHGATRDLNETSHKIAAGTGAVTNYDDMRGSTTVSLDALKSLVDLARSRGIKLGIIDLSCHSGSTLALADENTCVISATGPEHYSGAGPKSFGALFAGELTPGKTLEEVYLSARGKFVDPSFPMISSPAGGDVQSRIYDALTPYLYYYNPHSDKLTPFLERMAFARGECSIDDGFRELMVNVDEISRVTGSALREKMDAFRGAVTEYHSYLHDLKKKMDEFGVGEIGKLHRVCFEGTCQDYSGKELASGNFTYFASLYDRYAREARTSADRASYRNQAEIARLAQRKKEEVLSRTPALTRSRDFWAGLVDLQRQSYIYQSNVSRTQQELYLEMYQRSKASGPNPCREFKL